MSLRLAWHSEVVRRLVTKTYANVKTQNTSSSGALSAPYSSPPVPRPFLHAALPVNTSSSRLGAECRAEPSQHYPDWGWLAGLGRAYTCTVQLGSHPFNNTEIWRQVQKWTLRTQCHFFVALNIQICPSYISTGNIII